MLAKRSPAVVAVYLAWAALTTLLSARLFYSYLLQQTEGEWSAPLDDVFIHFDYARATARGYPFQWTEGNGYSSGGTSILYPLVLALGYWVGFRGPELMVWAAMVAAVSVLGWLWSSGRLFERLPAPALALLPVALFSVGALGWSLWSGMEVAFFLGVWALALALAGEVIDDTETRGERASWGLGLAGVLVVLTRPEAATSVAVLGLWAALAQGRRHGWRAAAGVLLRAGVPAAVTLVVQALVNKALTGESTANGALVKLALHNPYMTAEEKFADWRFNLRYVFDRLTWHHFGESRPWGLVPLVLAVLGLFDRRTRAPVVLLLSSAVLWVMVVALNGQVRWQNERYVMPAVAWLLAASALGLAAVTMLPATARARWPRTAAGVVLSAGLLAMFWRAERVQYRDQVWFFGRASRNIRDQHTTTGRLLRTMQDPPRRLLVGDAGALLYASDLPGFDLIGLGGYHDLPLARAGVHGLPATLELLERVPPSERPDVMAIYPTWWPALPYWFGRELFSVPVRGNVICGGAAKVVYQADWHLLGTGTRPRSQRPGEQVVDEIDPADLVNEKQHGYAFPQPQGGFLEMRVLADPEAPEHDLWDAGRRIPNERTERFRVRGLRPGRPARLILRTVVDRPSRLDVTLDGRPRSVELTPAPGWSEVSLDIDPSEVTAETIVTITPRQGEWVNYHVWGLTR